MIPLPLCLRLYTQIKRITLKHYLAEKKMQYWRQNKQKLLSLAEQGYRTRVESLGLDPAKVRSVVELGEIDQDGFLLSKVGSLSNVPSVSREHFLDRKRFGLRMVALNGYVGVEKNYKGNKSAFVNEIEAHYHLGLAGCNIPVIMDVNFDNLTLTFSYIRGRVLHDELASRGAVVRDRDIEDNPQLTWLGKKKRARRRIEESRRVLYDVIDSQFVEDLFTQLRRLHEARFIWNDIKYGNVIIEEYSGEPYLIDFDWTLRYPNLGPTAWRILCGRDIEKFNACFGPGRQTIERNVVCYAH
jgi:serine/threonine protein kinase